MAVGTACGQRIQREIEKQVNAVEAKDISAERRKTSKALGG